MPLQMTEEEFISLGIQVQDEGFNALNQHLASVESHIQDVGAAVESVNQISDAPLEKLSDHFSQTNKQIQETNASLDKLRAGLGDMPDVDGEGGEGGGLQLTGLRRTGSALTQLGLGEIGRPVSLIGDVQQVGKTIDELGSSLEHLPGIFGTVAAQGEALAGGFGGLIAVAGPLALAIGGIGVALKAFFDEIEKGQKAVDQAEQGLVGYYKLVDTGTSESILKQIDGQKAIQDANDNAIAVNQKKIDDLLADATKGLSPELAKTVREGILSGTKEGAYSATEIVENAGNNAQDLLGIQIIQKAIEPLQKASADAATNIDQYNQALGDTKVKANDAKEAEQKLQAERDQQADKNIQIATQNAQLEATGSSKSIEDRIKSIQAEKQAIEDEQATQELSIDKRQQLVKQFEDLTKEENTLTNTILPAVKAREAEEKATKDTQKAINDITHANDAYSKSVQSAKEALDNSIQSAKQREALAEEQNRPGSLQDTEAREKIRLDEGRKETQIAQESADRLVDIRAKEGQAEQQVAVDLQRQFADDVTKFQEQQQTDAMDHEQRLAEIRRNAQDAELDDIANRDFAKLAQDQAGAKKQESQEDQKFADQEQKLAIHLQQEEKQQQVAAQRRLEDLRNNEVIQIQEQAIADQRKLDALRQSEQYQLDDLTTAEGYKIQILRVGLQNEITLFQAASTQRIQILQNELQAAQAHAQQQIARLNPTGSAILDLGGTLNDQLAQMFSQ